MKISEHGNGYACPACKKLVINVTEKCVHCGFNPLTDKVPERPSPAWSQCFKVSRTALTAMIIGSITAAVLTFGDFSFITFVLSYFNTLIHEFGHSLVSWLLGYPSIPSFDFHHGGGVALSLSDTPNPKVLCGVGALLCWLIYISRHSKILISAAVSLSTILVSCYVLGWDQIAILYMGHGTVLIIAIVFIFRGLSNVAVHHFGERVLYFFLASFVLFEEHAFTVKLLTDMSERTRYLQGKGGLMHDFVRLAREVPLTMDNLLNMHSVFTMLTPIAAYLIYVVAAKHFYRELNIGD